MMRTPDELFGLEVQAQREEKEWSMTDFASMLSSAGLTHFHPTTVGRMERGERPVRLSEAVVIAKVLGAKLDDLVVEPLAGDDELRFAMNAVESMSKRAARCLLTASGWKDEVKSEISEVSARLADGKILEDNVAEVERALEDARILLREDRVAHWTGVLSRMDPEDLQALYKSDSDFQIS